MDPELFPRGFTDWTRKDLVFWASAQILGNRLHQVQATKYMRQIITDEADVAVMAAEALVDHVYKK